MDNTVTPSSTPKSLTRPKHSNVKKKHIAYIAYPCAHVLHRSHCAYIIRLFQKHLVSR